MAMRSCRSNLHDVVGVGRTKDSLGIHLLIPHIGSWKGGLGARMTCKSAISTVRLNAATSFLELIVGGIRELEVIEPSPSHALGTDAHSLAGSSVGSYA